MMEVAHLSTSSAIFRGLTRTGERNVAIRRGTLILPVQSCTNNIVDQQRPTYRNHGVGIYLSFRHENFLPLLSRRKKHQFPLVRNQAGSDCSVEPQDVEEHTVSSDMEDELVSKEDYDYLDSKEEDGKFTATNFSQPHSHDVKRELLMLSLPALAGQAIDPLAQLMETAYIGRLGAIELGSAGVSISIFNTISKLFNIPLLSVATSFVAEDFSKNSDGNADGGTLVAATQRKQLSSVSTALLLAVGFGIVEAVALYFGSGQFLNMMGVSPSSPMHGPAQRFLSLRALGAPAVVVSLALQGIFRGFKDTRTPVVCLGFGNLIAVFLFPLLMYSCQLGVTGAALSTVISQYLVAFVMIWYLNKRVILLPPKLGALQFAVYIRSGGFLLGRTFALLTTMTIGTSMAARQGPLSMAAHQICMQVWMGVSLLTDALAASAQALIASSLSKADYRTVREVTNFVLKIGLLTGVSLAAILGVSFGSLSTLFTKDADVLGIVSTGVVFVSASQPFNALAYVFDGLHYGASDFPYAACSMTVVGVTSSAFLLYVPTIIGLRGVWLGLALFMGLRTAAGYFRLSDKSGPWWFMHRDMQGFELAS